MEVIDAVKSPKSEDVRVPAQPSISLPTDLVDKIRNFIALTNNHLMAIPVQGDLILGSAKVMNLAIEIHEELEVIKNE